MGDQAPHRAEETHDREAAVADEDDAAARQPAAGLENALPRPVRQTLVGAAALAIVPFGGREHREVGQRLDPPRPGDGAQHHEAQPTQAARLHEMRMARADGVAVDAARGDLRTPTALDRVVHADHHRAVRHEAFDDQRQEPAGERARSPARAVEDLMIAGEVGGVGATGHAQRRRHGAFAGREQSSHHEDEDTLPDGRREAGPEGLQPGAQDLGDGIAGSAGAGEAGAGSAGAGEAVRSHPPCRIPRPTSCNTNGLRQFDSPMPGRRPRRSALCSRHDEPERDHRAHRAVR